MGTDSEISRRNSLFRQHVAIPIGLRAPRSGVLLPCSVKGLSVFYG